MNKDCILFIHRGESWYLYYTIKQARYFHPKATIAVITDSPQKNLQPYAGIYNIDDYWDGARELEAIYEHHSPNSTEFELLCFQRWFVLRDFLARHKPERAIHLDSDILVYDNLFKDFERMSGASLGIVGYQGPFSMLIPDRAVIASFCERIKRLYEDEKRSLEELYKEWTKVSTYVAVSDMHALHTFISSESLATLDLGKIHAGTAYDSTVHDSDGYAMEDGIKSLAWMKGIPWARREETGEAVRLKTIHCQGRSKARIQEFFTARDLRFWCDKVFFKAQQLMGKAAEARA